MNDLDLFISRFGLPGKYGRTGESAQRLKEGGILFGQIILSSLANDTLFEVRVLEFSDWENSTR